jgi:hypothetical protein
MLLQNCPFSTIDAQEVFAHRNASSVKEADHVRAHHVVPMTREEARNAGRKFLTFRHKF